MARRQGGSGEPEIGEEEATAILECKAHAVKQARKVPGGAGERSAEKWRTSAFVLQMLWQAKSQQGRVVSRIGQLQSVESAALVQTRI
ncbi:hypothetical protein NDU88_001370 [Pleurodeles waltl]|uniref:Uncharacterized protein n=1 Tax=Pleurodeles waltl TaxID=8319 RepID=A0AAV7P6K6_PLEWA|nr:hypothetical protein NDU88_001370 [Pleurodeles waltl]